MRIAFLNAPFTHVVSIRDAFLRSPHEVCVIELAGKKPKEIFAEIEKIKPDLCFIMNLHFVDPASALKNKEVQEFFETNRRPTAIWIADHPRYQMDFESWQAFTKLSDKKNYFLFLHDKSLSSTVESLGFSYVHLPLGVNRDIFQFRRAGREDLWKTNLRYTGKAIIGSGLKEISLETIRMG